MEPSDDSPGAVAQVREEVSYWTSVRAAIADVLRVNERSERESDLKEGFFILEQRARGEKPIPLELGRLYVLLLPPADVGWKPTG